MRLLVFSFLGCVFGMLNGFISVYFLKKNLRASDKSFFRIFVILILYKLVFILLSVWFMRYEKVIIILLYCFFLVFFQIFFVLYNFYGFRFKRDP